MYHFSFAVCDPVHGNWSEWNDPGEDNCTKRNLTRFNTLYDYYHRTLSRSCNNPTPKFGGKFCSNHLYSTRQLHCSSKIGEWSEWIDPGIFTTFLSNYCTAAALFERLCDKFFSFRLF